MRAAAIQLSIQLDQRQVLGVVWLAGQLQWLWRRTLEVRDDWSERRMQGDCGHPQCMHLWLGRRQHGRWRGRQRQRKFSRDGSFRLSVSDLIPLFLCSLWRGLLATLDPSGSFRVLVCGARLVFPYTRLSGFFNVVVDFEGFSSSTSSSGLVLCCPCGAGVTCFLLVKEMCSHRRDLAKLFHLGQAHVRAPQCSGGGETS